MKLIKITVELTEAQAAAFAQFAKRVGYSDFARLSDPTNPDEPYLMQEGTQVIRDSLGKAGFAPR